MGCGDKWCMWISKCVSSASISVLINGSPTPCFSLGRELRQGCPLSPLLFNVVGEALSRLIKKATDWGLFHGFLIGRGEMMCHSHICNLPTTSSFFVERHLRRFVISREF
ncbi:hypothetical protein HRI_000335500 [Hibiscus trionum]|uniref:Reverse transcriptase domain-containing protein n=1 Tax=Hibiscus trionum TaxID=183268 RepID=A0A9W7LJI4_HIBTR|nr:hypothetical protein HRI_000335500 [Hibiscus trionum]